MMFNLKTNMTFSQTSFLTSTIGLHVQHVFGAAIYYHLQHLQKCISPFGDNKKNTLDL